MDFPIFRKYKGIEVWFKIESLTNFTEVKMIGNRIILTEIKAKIYPEMQFINDMINCYENRWEEIEKADYLKAIEQNNSVKN